MAPDPEPPPSSLVASLRRALRTLLALAFSRVELLAVEWEEERRRLAVTLLLVLAAGSFGLLGLFMVNVTLLVICPIEHRGWLAGGLTLIHLAMTVAILWWIKHRLRSWQPFAGTLGELRKDAAALKENRHE